MPSIILIKLLRLTLLIDLTFLTIDSNNINKYINFNYNKSFFFSKKSFKINLFLKLYY